MEFNFTVGLGKMTASNGENIPLEIFHSFSIFLLCCSVNIIIISYKVVDGVPKSKKKWKFHRDLDLPPTRQQQFNYTYGISKYTATVPCPTRTSIIARVIYSHFMKGYKAPTKSYARKSDNTRTKNNRLYQEKPPNHDNKLGQAYNDVHLNKAKAFPLTIMTSLEYSDYHCG
ncbi:uncharacterized protein LOC123894502 [Trifolium pratense]|uniref:uncharacterized protein LOC123894502 n=1 Tax=Trifolium pratense TaxID=57577 RepID=UPI001E696BCF|nr:uncharacterized protein LOC123894502 [Trifolium pratense]